MYQRFRNIFYLNPKNDNDKNISNIFKIIKKL